MGQIIQPQAVRERAVVLAIGSMDRNRSLLGVNRPRPTRGSRRTDKPPTQRAHDKKSG